MCFYCGTSGLPKKNQWNAYNAISSCAFGLSITRNLITRGLSICQAKLTKKARRWSKRVSSHSITFDCYSVLLVNTTMSARKSKLQVKLPLIKTTKRNIKTVFFLASLIVLRTNWTHNFKVFLTLKQWFTFQILAMCDEK